MLNFKINKIFATTITSLDVKQNSFSQLFLSLQKPTKRELKNIRIARQVKAYQNYLYFKKNKVSSLYDPYKFVDTLYLNNRFFVNNNLVSFHQCRQYYKYNNIRSIFFTLKSFKNIKSIVNIKRVYSFSKKKIIISKNNINLKNNNNYGTKINKNIKAAKFKSKKYFLLTLKKRNKRLKNRFFFFNNFFFYFIVKFINIIMKCGKKDKSISIFRNLIFYLLLIYPKKNPFYIILAVFFNLRIVLFFKKKKVAGRVHHVPFFLNNVKQVLVGLKVFISVVRASVGNGFVKKLVNEFILIFNKDVESNFMKKKKKIFIV